MKAMMKELLAHILGPDFRYPVGSYYETSDANFDPNIEWGGTWVLEDGGRVHISSGKNIANTTNFWGVCNANELNFPLGERGGEHSHKLTVDEMPSHIHAIYAGYGDGGTGRDAYRYQNWASAAQQWWNDGMRSTDFTGGSQAHHNLQPYTVVNRWHRTA